MHKPSDDTYISMISYHHVHMLKPQNVGKGLIPEPAQTAEEQDQ